MGHSNALTLVDGIDSFCSLFQDLQVSMMVGLSTTAYTASRTSHNLNGMVVALSFSDVLQKRSGVSKAIGDGNVQFEVSDFNGCLTESFHSTHFIVVNLINCASCELNCCGS